MKKTLSIAMAIAMMASMAAMASAKVGSIDTTTHITNNDNQVVVTDKNIAYGKTIYMPLLNEENNNIVTDSADVKSLSVKTSWDMNGSAVSNTEVVKKKDTSNDYGYYLGINTKENNSTKTTDVSGKITFKKSGTDAVNFSEDISFTLGHPEATGDITSTLSIHTFNDDTEETLGFTGGYFTVNTVGQSDLLLRATTRYNSDVAAAHPSANLDFVTFNNASFNRIGELTIEAPEGSFLYAVNADGSVSAIKAEYDEQEEAFKLKTRTLGAYVISDSELKTGVSTGTSSESENNSGTTENVKPNPSTGAIA